MVSVASSLSPDLISQSCSGLRSSPWRWWACEADIGHSLYCSFKKVLRGV